ncbi:MAG TPA: carboxypeptidase-like regulatory domain-containing protein [Acidobacteriaceae bacterium]|nr:carboxypeptidase-like regulatory domain-containing protein [Acidobacteriaceae bacterium]
MMRALRRISSIRRMGALLAGALLLGLLPAALSPAMAQDQNFGVKQLQGKVLGNNDAPLSEAIVYLQNSRTNDIKSYITEKDGAYHFAGLAADTDYTVWAAFKGKKSSTKTVSSFDTRKQVFIDLHIKE